MSTSGRFFLLFFLAWAALWGTPARAAEIDTPDTPGTSVQKRPAAEPLLNLRDHPEPRLAHREVLEASEPLPSDPLGRAPAEGPGAEPPATDPSALARSASGSRLFSDILLLIQRQNE